MGRLINNKGMALITTLMLALITSTIIGTLMYMLNTSTNISGINKSYTNATIATRSASDYIIYKLLDNESELCNGICNDNTTLELSEYNKIGKYNINALLLSKLPVDNNTFIYSISLSASDNLSIATQLEFTVSISTIFEAISSGMTN